ncbi:DUF427 domain-containing protein [Nocardioides sp. MAHUQ-72]|uniref:DUF427 domain-containing protein n=1 Tax=unclassified Nocardioides TaxID=2615069 RepID=UPI00361F91CC
MAVRMRDLVMGALPQLRVHPVQKWVRATVGDVVVVDSQAPRLVWEPRRIVPSYAVPREDLRAELLPHAPAADPDGQEQPVPSGSGGPPVLDPRTPFAVHSTPGTPLTVLTPQAELPGAAFAPDDPDLAGYVVLDWRAFTLWFEEDEPVMGHPHDPFDRIDCLRSIRHVRIGLDGVLLADSRRATLLFETPLPVRYYLPREDVAMDLLEPSRLRTVCAYKGRASYWSARAGEELLRDIAWTYERPLHDAVPVQGMVAFFTERLDVVVDGAAVPRPVTPWSDLPPG